MTKFHSFFTSITILYFLPLLFIACSTGSKESEKGLKVIFPEMSEPLQITREGKEHLFASYYGIIETSLDGYWVGKVPGRSSQSQWAGIKINRGIKDRGYLYIYQFWKGTGPDGACSFFLCRRFRQAGQHLLDEAIHRPVGILAECARSPVGQHYIAGSSSVS